MDVCEEVVRRSDDENSPKPTLSLLYCVYVYIDPPNKAMCVCGVCVFLIDDDE